MGHVDHGKTTLLDHIRKTNVADREAGGITQAIGAYEIEHDGRKITFIDTPGHEAFSKMRAHGAKVADIAILVVAADDGVKPQTQDALKRIGEAGIPFVVAVNKIDKPNADVDKTKNDLANAGVLLEGYGGNVSWNAISAKNGEGVGDLLDLVLLAADVENPEWDPDATPSGVVLTSKSDPRRGNTVGVVIRNGVLEKGSPIATESASGKVKMLNNFLGKNEKSLEPSSPALILGFDTLPEVGEIFYAGGKAEELASEKKEEKVREARDPGALESEKKVPVVAKADDGGTLEVLEDLLERMREEYPIVVVSSGVGDIYENDVKMAESSGAIVVGFNVKTDKAAVNLAQTVHVPILSSKIIYELEKSVRDYAKKLSPDDIPALEVLAIFGEPKGKERVIGGKVLLGPVKNQSPFEVWRGDKQVGTGKILNLQSGREDVQEAQAEEEAGLLVECGEAIKKGDRLLFVEE